MTNSPVSNDSHPLLKAALGTLDMTVESEMSLFRQHQTLADLPQDMDDEGEGPQLLPEALEPETIPADETLISDNVEQGSLSHLNLGDDVAEDLTPSELALFQVDTASEVDPENSDTSLEQQEAVLEPSPTLEQSSPVARAPLPSEVEENDPHVSKLDPAIEDYLDSSTALRQHLEDAVAEPEALSETQTFTPKKLILLLGGSLLGALVVVFFLNVTGLRNKLWPSQQPQPQPTQSPASPSEPSQSSLSPTAEPQESPAAAVTTQGPDLSKKEFSDVNLGSLSRLQPSASPTPSAAAPTRATPTPPASQKPVPILKNQTSQTGLFYVVLPYDNAASLQQARKLVPTAFLINGSGGQQIQVGALATMEAAQRLAKQLRTNGLAAAIIAPN